MDPHHLDVENLDFGIDACNEFNPFEDDESPISSRDFPQPNPIGKRPRASMLEFLCVDLHNHFDNIINQC